MALERFIRGKIDSAKHAGRHANQKRLDSAMEQERDYPLIIYDAHLDKLLYKNPNEAPVEKLDKR